MTKTDFERLRHARDRHEEVVMHAEVRLLARALRPFGVLSRDALKRIAGAEHWHEGGFDRALAAAVRSGAIEAEPLGFYRIAPEPTHGSAA